MTSANKLVACEMHIRFYLLELYRHMYPSGESDLHLKFKVPRPKIVVSGSLVGSPNEDVAMVS